jgi:hypothetical protein
MSDCCNQVVTWLFDYVSVTLLMCLPLQVQVDAGVGNANQDIAACRMQNMHRHSLFAAVAKRRAWR